MIFSHNNSCSFLTAELGLSYIHVPTCGLLIFDFDVSLWSQVSVENSIIIFQNHLDERLYF